MISFSVHNFGCRVNQAEAFSWVDELQMNGLRLTGDCTESDFVLVNSCTLTSRADRDVRQFIKRIPRLNPRTRIIVTGCLVDRAFDEFREIPQVWQLIRNTDKNELVARMLSVISPSERTQPQSSRFRSRALLKIQDGCDFHCTFCVIPGVRGKSVSVPKGEVLSRAGALASRGYREVVLTGVHLCSYGDNLTPRTSLVELLHCLESSDGPGKFRLSSLDPRFLTPPWLAQLISNKKVCPHFHLSLQHGSDGILMRMGRKSQVVDYQGILSSLRRHSPRAALGADIIVGFPGETNEDFEKMYAFLEQSPLTYLHVFSYSPRPGTPASSWPQVEGRAKKERSRQLRKLSLRKNLDFRRQFLGQELEGIVVRKQKRGTEVMTSNYIKVLVPEFFPEEREEVTVSIERVAVAETAGRIR